MERFRMSRVPQAQGHSLEVNMELAPRADPAAMLRAQFPGRASVGLE